MKKSKLKAQDLNRYRTQLLSMSNRLSSDVGHLENEAMQSMRMEKAGVDEPAQQADWAVREAEAEVARTLLNNEEHILKDVRVALAHLIDGTFGLCETCGQRISKVRLDVLPYARQCVGCSSNLAKIETT